MRLDEDTCIIPTSFDNKCEAKEWESTAVIPWVFSLPQGAGVRQVEETILDELRLLRGEVHVSTHSPEAFLIKFENKKHCEAALRRRCIKRNGVILCLRQNRSLKHAIGARFFYRVRICLEGVPRHAWLPNVVERLLGRSCSVQYIETDLLHPTDSRSICLSAWSRNPSKIPKKIGLTFTNRAMGDASSSWQVTEEPPEKWQFGATFQVLVHLDLMEDYTAAPTPLPGFAMPPFTPAQHPFVWFWGKADGEPGPDRVYEHSSSPHAELHDGNRGRGRDQETRRRRGSSPADADDHPGFLPLRRRDESDDDEDRSGWRDHRRAEGRSNGRGWQQGLGGSKARTRSPRRRVQGRSACDRQRHHQLPLPAGLEFKLPSMEELRARDAEGLQKLFAVEAAALRANLSHILTEQMQQSVEDALGPARAWLQDAVSKQERWLKEAEEYIGKSCVLADKLNISKVPLLSGNQAWSRVATIPISTASGRILHALPVHTFAASCVADRVETGEMEAGEVGLTCPDTPMVGAAAGGGVERLTCPDPPVEVAAAASEVEGLTCPDPPVEVAAAAGEMVGLTRPVIGAALGGTQVADLRSSPLHALPGRSSPPPTSPSQEVERFFSTPCPPLLQQAPPPRQQSRRKTYDMANVHRSARLASRPAMPAMKRAQIVLSQEDRTSVEQALKEYVAMYDTSLPSFAIAALSNVLCVDDQYMEQLDEALISLVGQGIDGLLDEEGGIAARD
ncbi:hypothetical protein BS78_10G213600 [Paspalum vaginatum]|nr:hypothetical protein BS78_10G213600 [Paspalum vaginatum]